MSKDSLTLYRLIVLYMLSRVNYPLSAAQIADFILEKEYTNYLTLQQVLSELEEDRFVESSTMGNRTLLAITDEGRHTLDFFAGRLQPGICKDIQEYLEAHELQIRNDLSILTNYRKESNGSYTAELVAKDHSNELIRLQLNVPTAKYAQAVCDRWKEKNESIYQYLINELF